MESFRIPVIGLPDVVFYPNTVMPLYIVDPTYTKLIRELEAGGGLLALALCEDLNTQNSTILTPRATCTAGHPIILEENDDGTLKILVKGVCKMELLSVEQNLPYPVFNAKMVEDDIVPEASFDSPKLERISEILDNWLERNIKDSVEREVFQQNIKNIYEIVDYTCMFIIKDIEIKQILLENKSFIGRIHLLDTLLKGDIPLKEDFIVSNALKSYEDLEQNKIVVNH